METPTKMDDLGIPPWLRKPPYVPGMFENGDRIPWNTKHCGRIGGGLGLWLSWDIYIFYRKLSWLVVSTPLKNISQLGWLFPIYGKIKNVPNHQPVSYLRTNLTHPKHPTPPPAPFFRRNFSARPSSATSCSAGRPAGTWEGNKKALTKGSLRSKKDSKIYNSKMILKWFWDDSEMILRWFWNDSEMILKRFWEHSQTILRWFWNDSKMILKWF